MKKAGGNTDKTTKLLSKTQRSTGILSERDRAFFGDFLQGKKEAMQIAVFCVF
jgi:hypothetical protein